MGLAAGWGFAVGGGLAADEFFGDGGVGWYEGYGWRGGAVECHFDD